MILVGGQFGRVLVLRGSGFGCWVFGLDLGLGRPGKATRAKSDFTAETRLEGRNGMAWNGMK